MLEIVKKKILRMEEAKLFVPDETASRCLSTLRCSTIMEKRNKHVIFPHIKERRWVKMEIVNMKGFVDIKKNERVETYIRYQELYGYWNNHKYH